MGIHKTWKSYLIELYPNCWYKNLPDEVKVNHIIDDWTIRYYGLVSGARTGTDIQVNIKNIFLYYHKDSLRFTKEISVLFDEREYTPLAKQVKQRERKKNATKYSNATPYTMKEIMENRIRISDGILPDLDRIALTPRLIDDVFRYCTDFIRDSNHEILLRSTIWVHGGRETSKDDDLKTVPIEFKKTNFENNAYDPNTNYVLNNNQSNITIIKGTPIMGETDIKIVHHINNSNYRDILVRSSDSDTICILLLNMRNWLSKDTGGGKTLFTKHIWWDDCFGNILDVNALWLSIIERFKKKYNLTKYYIETMVILMLISGSDFNNNFNGLGPKTVYSNFEDTGYDVMFGSDKEPLIDFKNDTFVINDSQKRASIVIKESKMIRFMETFFVKKMFKKKPYDTKRKKRGSNEYDDNNSDRMSIDDFSDKNNGFLVDKFKIPNKAELAAWTRRIWWLLDYWMNAYKKCGYMNEIEIDDKTKLSKCGYIQIKEENDLKEIVTKVVYANRVVIFKVA